MHSLETRRLQRDEIVLYKIIHNEIDVQLHEFIYYRQINRFTKNVDVFYVPNWSTNVEINSPLLRLQRHHDMYFNVYDVLDLPMSLFKFKVKNHFPF